MTDIEKKFAAIQLDEKVIATIIKNKKVVAALSEIVDMAGGKVADKTQGQLLYKLAMTLPGTQDAYKKDFVERIMAGKWDRVLQLEEGYAFVTEQLKAQGNAYKIDGAAFEAATGVGVVVTEAEVDKMIEDQFTAFKEEIAEKGWAFNFNQIVNTIKKTNKWADGKMVITKLNAKKEAVCGPKPDTKAKRPKINAKTNDEKKEAKVKAENAGEDAGTGKDILKLIGRDCTIGANTEKHIKSHAAFKNSQKAQVVTRFPPEPNGYLHIGHAKAIRFNFLVAKENDGICYLRFDDTNPCKENHEFIDHIKKNVAWLGYEPWKVSASSDYFQELFDLAVGLIKQDKAYVCFQTGDEMHKYREERKDSPYRNKSAEENLKLFEHMRQGRFNEGECCLRVKMDMKSDNPNMRDFVAYRIRFISHPHSGDKWCIYPTYDYTHCLVDSIENITHSLCTLEFETRRESYYQLLKDCDVYKPNVWEYSRLNVSNTVLSKRRIEKLVNEGHVEGWADPRLLTLEGLRRRGYTPSMLNAFCKEIGVARKGNENVTSIKLLEHFARIELDKLAPRTFGVLDPILLKITNFKDLKNTKFEAMLFPGDIEDKSRGIQVYNLTENIYIEKDDFSEVHNTKNFGLSPEQPCRLKYGYVIKLVSIEKNADGSIDHLKVEALPDYDKKPKGIIHWVSKEHSFNASVNLYSVHFLTEAPSKDKWMDEINPNSLITKPDAKIWKLHKNAKVDDRFQFERVGFFVLNDNSNPKKGKYCFNRIVELKESKEKAMSGGAAAGKK